MADIKNLEGMIDSTPIMKDYACLLYTSDAADE